MNNVPVAYKNRANIAPTPLYEKDAIHLNVCLRRWRRRNLFCMVLHIYRKVKLIEISSQLLIVPATEILRLALHFA